MRRFSFGVFLGFGLMSTFNMASELGKKYNLPSRKQFSEISNKVCDELLEFFLKRDSLSKAEAKVVLFQLHTNIARRLKNQGFDVMVNEPFPYFPENITDADAALFIKELEEDKKLFNVQ
jgi:hypothetical protein